MDAYRARLAQRLDPTAAFLQSITSAVQASPTSRIVFAEGEEPSVIRAAYAFETQGLGKAILVGREETVRANMKLVGLSDEDPHFEIVNARLSDHNPDFVDYLYARLQREGYLKRDVQRLINQDRNAFAASMVALGLADGMVTGVTRSFDVAMEEVLRAIDPAPDGRLIGMSVMLAKGHTLFVADTSFTELPTGEELVEIAVSAANAVRRLGITPRVAFMSYSTFGNPAGDRSAKVREAVALLDTMGVDFEDEGEMPPTLALEPHTRTNFPFMRLTGPANVLIMPAVHSASISTKLVQVLGGATVIGPFVVGMSRPVQIAPLSASVSTILTMATLCAYENAMETAQ
jgi:malate dehydrogenase (oxaloacetate-decarboxylating)(NADP+)